jgi:xanthine dehydrogenase YagS FAD-binding subunit
MHDFDYLRAPDLDTALAQGERDGAWIAGGTELLNWMRLGIAAPARVVDIARIEALRGIEATPEGLRIGALATRTDVGLHPQVAARARALAQACLQAASAQVRHRATLGGNLLQKTRCAYFRAEAPLPWPCNKRAPGSGCAARHGLNEHHALLGWTEDCVAVQPSDPAVALACLDAEVQIAGPQGLRSVPAAAFHLSQQEARDAGGDAACLENRLAPGELITALRIPLPLPWGSAYVKVRERASYEYALVSAAAAVAVAQGHIVSARLALGSVAQRPWRLPSAESALVGLALDAEALAPVIDAALQDARPLAHNAWKRPMACQAAVRALLQAGEQEIAA